ncbi:MAG: 1-acyl-sn-glycerol-3-phosphate acyltransferase [Pseudomonadota bacterium]
MLFDPVTLPLWQLLVLAGIAVIFLIEKLFVPSVRWVLRRKVNRVITEINEHLQIEIRPFQLTKRRVLIDRLAFDPPVLEALEAHVNEHQMPREVAQEEVRKYAKEIVPAFNAFVYYRFIYRLCRFVCRQLYRIRVGVADENDIRGIDKDATVVFVMNHRSNVDYMLVAYLASRQTTLSYAAGEWAKVFLLQSLIRAMGAFFVRRNSRNPLYRKVLERYVHMATREGVCQAVFPEGGLTKTGALAPPKLGFLDYMLRGYDTHKDRDIVFIPVGINYDKVLEDQVQINAGKGIRASRSLAGWVLSVTKFIAVHFSKPKTERRDLFGYASVNFGHTVSAQAFARHHGINFVNLDKEKRFEYTAMLAEKLMNGIGYVTPILPAPLLAELFIRDPGAKFSENQVIIEVHKLVDTLIEKGAPMRAAEKPARRTVEKTLALMSHYGLLKRSDGYYSLNAERREIAEYYAQSIRHWFDGIDHIDPNNRGLADAA